MSRHFIILSSSYSQGQRIAFDVVEQESSDSGTSFKEVLRRVKEECGKDVSLSTHYMETADATWESVVKEDSFFDDVLLVDSLDKFIEVINADRTLSGLDIAKYILSKCSCTQLKLQKLVYYCYAEYLCRTEKPLFRDDIYAFQYGPVVKSVLDAFKGYRYIDTADVSPIAEVASLRMPIKSRILFANDGLEKLQCIDETLERYGHLQARQLVDLTHRQGTPWTVSFDGGDFRSISKEAILQRHSFEQL